jgi:hypothetical protein
MNDADVRDPAPWHDPELPFLDVLEQEVRRRAQHAAIHHEQRQRLPFAQSISIPERRAALARRSPAAAAPAPVHIASHVSRRLMSLRGPARVARRSLTLMALLCLIGASAYGASEVFSGAAPNPLAARRGAFAQVASGGAGTAAWTLRLYMRGGELCRVLSVAEYEASDCAPAPSARRVEATSAESPSHDFVFGVVGGDVASVRVRLGSQSQTIRTEAPDSDLRRIAGLPAHLRFYLATWQRKARTGEVSATVEGLSASDQPLDKPQPSCLETGEPGRC